jgi:DNA-binding transcriptional ArsR family regulator
MGIEDAVSFALGHEVRLEMLSMLNERERNAAELARLLHTTLSVAQHHLAALVKAGSVEEAERRHVGNHVVRFYRAVSRSHFSAEEMAEMDPVEQRVTVGLALQNSFAEHLSAFRGGEMRGSDPLLALFWNWYNVDETGRHEITEELEESWDRVQQIEARSVERRLRTGEDAQTLVVSMIAHPRVRPAPKDRRPFGSLVTHQR